MNKAKKEKEYEMRPSYKASDFPRGLVRGKYAARMKESSNVVVLRPEVAEVFPNEDAVNEALLSLINLAKKTTRATTRKPTPEKAGK